MFFADLQSAEVSIGCPRPREGWQSFQFNLKKFNDLITAKDCITTPEFSCNGHDWFLKVYPDGRNDTTEGYVSIYLHHRSKGSIAANFEVMIIDKFGNKTTVQESEKPDLFEGMGKGWGWDDFIKRSDILDESQNMLDSDGTLTLGVSIKEDPNAIFAPNNPLLKTIQGMFLNVDTADVCFEVCSAEANDGKKEAKASDLFHAHHFILKACSPMLANLFDLDTNNDGKLATATITEIKPDIFRHLLYYVYGGSVAEEDLKTHAKDIIDAADKYSIINLKLKAEAAYVKSTDITIDNAMEDLLYADAKNCALLKESVMNFVAENSTDAVEKISFTDFPGHIVKDLLVAFNRKGRSKKEASETTTDELSTLCVSALRRKLYEMGSSVDGSREAMIETIRNSS